jgi:hypothetical protein
MAEELAPGYPDIPREELGELAGAVEQTQLDQPIQLEVWREFMRRYPSYATLAQEVANRLDPLMSPHDAFLNGVELGYLLERQKQASLTLETMVNGSTYAAEADTDAIAELPDEISIEVESPRRSKLKLWQLGAAALGLSFLTRRTRIE